MDLFLRKTLFCVEFVAEFFRTESMRYSLFLSEFFAEFFHPKKLAFRGAKNEILQLRTMESNNVWVIVCVFLAGGRK